MGIRPPQEARKGVGVRRMLIEKKKSIVSCGVMPASLPGYCTSAAMMIAKRAPVEIALELRRPARLSGQFRSWAFCRS